MLPHPACVHQADVDADEAGELRELLEGIGVAPRGPWRLAVPRHDVEVAGHPLPLAQRLARRRHERAGHEGGGRKVVGGRVRGLEGPQALLGLGHHPPPELDPDPPRLAFEARRTRVVPHRFLARLRRDDGGRALRLSLEPSRAGATHEVVGLSHALEGGVPRGDGKHQPPARAFLASGQSSSGSGASGQRPEWTVDIPQPSSATRSSCARSAPISSASAAS